MSLNNYLPPIISVSIGLMLALLMFSSNNTAKLVGTVVAVAIILFYYKAIKEVFWGTEGDKIITILLIAIFGAGMIVVGSLPKTQWQLGILWAAWLIFCVLMLGKLSFLILNYEFALEMQEHECKQVQNIIEPYLKKHFGGAPREKNK